MSSDTNTTAPIDGTTPPEGAESAAPNSDAEVTAAVEDTPVGAAESSQSQDDATPADEGSSDKAEADEVVEADATEDAEAATDEAADVEAAGDTDAEAGEAAEAETDEGTQAESDGAEAEADEAATHETAEGETDKTAETETAETAEAATAEGATDEAAEAATGGDAESKPDEAAPVATGDAPVPLHAVRPPDIAAPAAGGDAGDDDGSATAEPARRRRWPWVAALLTAFAVFTAAGLFAGATMSYAESLQGRLLPGTTIAGTDVGGMTHDEALKSVRGALSEELDRTIVVKWRGQPWKTKARNLGAKTNAKDIIRGVAASQQGLSWQDWARLRWFGERADESAVVDVTYRRGAARRFVKSIADEVNLEPTDSDLTVEGNSIAVSASALGYKADRADAVDAVMRSVEGDAEPVRLGVKTLKPAVTESDYSQVLLLDQSDHRLMLFLDGEMTREWVVATGTGDFPTPLGRYHIELKRYMPTWVNPSPDGWGKDMPESIPPGPKNPLGVRALNWTAPAIRFHGTQAVDSLGTDASHGCVRMHNDDVSELYDLVDVGAVIVSQE